MILRKSLLNACNHKKRTLFNSRSLNYIQGQAPEPNTREYFYYIDHQGMLFLDDSRMKNFTSCFKEIKFLEFFFKRLQVNTTGKYVKEFPFYSPCAREKNFVRCDDVPIVFTHIMEIRNSDNELLEYLSYGYTGERLKIKFEPQKICMLTTSGRVYHPGPDATGGVGLIKSSLAIQLSHNFIYKDPNSTEDPPVFFMWKDKKHTLTNEILDKLKNISSKRSDGIN